jgi:hypothetical protein
MKRPFRTRVAERFNGLPVLVPLGRQLRLHGIHEAARFRASRGPAEPPSRAPLFVMGCGRSGTTILGNLLGIHPQVTYLNEPYHLWAAIHPALDLTNYHARVRPRLYWTDPASDDVRLRFLRLFGPLGRTGTLVEKTPHTLFRVEWLRSIVPDARFVNIRRSGADVIRSIDRIASASTYRQMRPNYNQWWGSHGCKWDALARECPQHGYRWNPALLTTSLDRGAYEWLTSLGEADRLAQEVGDHWLDVDHPELCRDPRGVLTRICEHAGLEPDAAWLTRCEQEIVEKPAAARSVVLHEEIREDFNLMQARFGFGGRGIASNDSSS